MAKDAKVIPINRILENPAFELFMREFLAGGTDLVELVQRDPFAFEREKAELRNGEVLARLDQLSGSTGSNSIRLHFARANFSIFEIMHAVREPDLIDGRFNIELIVGYLANVEDRIQDVRTLIDPEVRTRRRMSSFKDSFVDEIHTKLKLYEDIKYALRRLSEQCRDLNTLSGLDERRHGDPEALVINFPLGRKPKSRKLKPMRIGTENKPATISTRARETSKQKTGPTGSGPMPPSVS